MSHRDVYQEVTDSIVALLEAGTIPWRKPWTNIGAPQNLVSRHAYQGMNTFALAIKPFSSPYWLTFNQAKSLGGSVRKGERGTKIIFWRILQREFESDGGDSTVKKFPYLNEWTVFNAEQCDGIEVPATNVCEFTPIEAAENVVAAMPQQPMLYHNGGDRAFYHPLLDTIHMPQREHFTDANHYYATLFHELGHSTGHQSRLARPDLMNPASFGSDPYSREELVAEMTAAMVCGVTGIVPATVTNSAAYISGWLKALKGDKKLLITAAGLAQKAADFILNVEAADTAEAAA